MPEQFQKALLEREDALSQESDRIRIGAVLRYFTKIFKINVNVSFKSIFPIDLPVHFRYYIGCIIEVPKTGTAKGYGLSPRMKVLKR